FGAGVFASAQGPMSLSHAVRETLVVGGGLIAIALLVWTGRPAAEPVTSIRANAFCAGAAIYCGSYLLFENFDYRLVFLLLTLPQLLGWARLREAPLPLPHLALAAILAAMWLRTALPVLPAPFDRAWSPPRPIDEYLNWLVFVYLGAGLA